MKRHIITIFISGVILLLYPFIALSEILEYIYVTIPAVLVVLSSLVLAKKANLFSSDVSKEDSSLDKVVNRIDEEGYSKRIHSIQKPYEK